MSRSCTIAVPARVYYDALDPNASSMAEEIGLPVARFVKRGFGGTFYYDNVTQAQALEVAEYISERAFMLLGQDDDASVHRAAIKAASRIRGEVGRSV